MRATNMKKIMTKTNLLMALTMAVALLVCSAAYAAAPGIKGPGLPAVGGMGSDRPVTRDEFNALPSGSRFLAPDGQYHIKP